MTDETQLTNEVRHHDTPLQSRLAASFLIACSIAVMEVIGGVISNSLALLSDSGHVFADALAIIVSLGAMRIAAKPHTSSMTYGYHRTEILATFINGATLAGISLYIFIEAYRRIMQPPTVKGPTLLLFASIGLAANLGMLLLLKGGSKHSLNVKGAFLHVLGDTLSSVGVIIGGVIVVFTSIYLFDPIVGVIIGLLILRSSIGLLRESTGILMERVPKRMKPAEIAQEVMQVKGVKGAHDLHIWTITSGLHAFSGHIQVEEQSLSQASEILQEVCVILKERFGIDHVTIQLESDKGGIIQAECFECESCKIRR